MLSKDFVNCNQVLHEETIEVNFYLVHHIQWIIEISK